MSKRKRQVGTLASLVAVFAFTASVAPAQVKESFGSQGYLQYSATEYTYTCDVYHTYTEWMFSGFSFVDSWGNQYPVTAGGPTYYIEGSPMDLLGCPADGASEVQTPLYVGGSEIATFTPGMGSGGGPAVNLPTPGYVNPDYVVVGLLYDPPGTASSVSYASDTVVGTTTSESTSISSTTGGASQTYLDSRTEQSTTTPTRAPTHKRRAVLRPSL